MVLNLTHRAFKFTLFQHLDHQEVSLAAKSFTLCTSQVKSNQVRGGGVHEVAARALTNLRDSLQLRSGRSDVSAVGKKLQQFCDVTVKNASAEANMAANVSRLTCAITQRINIRAAGVQGKPAASSICARARINARNNNGGR